MGIPIIVVTLFSRVIERVKLDKRETTIGRGRENDIALNNFLISRHHAKIYTNEGKVEIKDLGSANGTFVNRTEVDEAELTTGDVVSIGNYVLKFYKEEVLEPEENPSFQSDEGTVIDARIEVKFFGDKK